MTTKPHKKDRNIDVGGSRKEKFPENSSLCTDRYFSNPCLAEGEMITLRVPNYSSTHTYTGPIATDAKYYSPMSRWQNESVRDQPWNGIQMFQLEPRQYIDCYHAQRTCMCYLPERRYGAKWEYITEIKADSVRLSNNELLHRNVKEEAGRDSRKIMDWEYKNVGTCEID